MTLMFPRIARNFAKKGYYPTDGGTIERVLQALDLPLDGEVRVFDPCCGEGVALAEIKHQLDPSRVTAFGIELDEERAAHLSKRTEAGPEAYFEIKSAHIAEIVSDMQAKRESLYRRAQGNPELKAKLDALKAALEAVQTELEKAN